MNTPILSCVVTIFNEFANYFGSDGKISKEDLKVIMDKNFGESIKENKCPDTIKELQEKVKPYLEKGATKDDIVVLLSCVLKGYAKDYVNIPKQ